jgi:hypothetical protein
MSRHLTAAVLAIAASATACEQSATAPAKTSGKGSKKQACLAIVNGDETVAPKAVGLIFREDGDTFSACTGTWVSSNTFFTAAHCTGGGGAPIYYAGNRSVNLEENYHERLANALQPVEQVISPISFVGGEVKGEDIHKDLAVLVFPKGSAPSVIPLLDRKPKKGESVEIVGFGRNRIGDQSSSESTASIKRRGRNKLKYLEGIEEQMPDALTIVGDYEDTGSSDSLGSNGDSGGPLLIDGALAGIASTAGRLTDAESREYYGGDAGTNYADLSSSFAREFMAKAEKKGAVFTRVGDEVDAEDDSGPGSDDDDESVDCD